MDKDILIWLFDIRKAIEEIYIFLPNKNDFNEFQNDLKTKKAIERNIESIREATNRILKLNPNIEVSNAKKIISTRNRIIHSYENVSDDIIWSIVTRELPLLKSEIENVLNTK